MVARTALDTVSIGVHSFRSESLSVRVDPSPAFTRYKSSDGRCIVGRTHTKDSSPPRSQTHMSSSM